MSAYRQGPAQPRIAPRAPLLRVLWAWCRGVLRKNRRRQLVRLHVARCGPDCPYRAPGPAKGAHLAPLVPAESPTFTSVLEMYGPRVVFRRNEQGVLREEIK